MTNKPMCFSQFGCDNFGDHTHFAPVSHGKWKGFITSSLIIQVITREMRLCLTLSLMIIGITPEMDVSSFWMQIIVELHKETCYRVLRLSPSCYITLQHTKEQHTMLHHTTEYYEVLGNTRHTIAYYSTEHHATLKCSILKYNTSCHIILQNTWAYYSTALHATS